MQQVRVALSSGLAAGLTGDTFKDGPMNADQTKLSQEQYNFKSLVKAPISRRLHFLRIHSDSFVANSQSIFLYLSLVIVK